MRSDSSITVNYANHSPAFIKFQEQYKNLCQSITELKKREIIKAHMKASTFFYEYKTYIRSQDVKVYIEEYLSKLKEELYNDIRLEKLSTMPTMSIAEEIEFEQKYYHYLIKTLKIVGLFGDELSQTFMPNKTDRVKLFKFWNNNSFFEQFTYYKGLTAERLSEFNIKKFKDSFTYFLGFYFAYYLFIEEKSRFLCEKLFSNIISIYSNKQVLNLIKEPKNNLSVTKIKELKDIEFEIHNGLNNIFGRCNYSYSLYGVMPRIEEKVLQDRTLI